jgi:glyoxylase-like metal-dependent hydrolase (beta-lactamase superfamily II)
MTGTAGFYRSIVSTGEAVIMDALNRPMVTGFYDAQTGSIQYVVADPQTRRCAIIDPVLDYDEKSATTATGHADRLLQYIEDEGLALEWILDTHPHADHFSAASYLKEKTGVKTAIGAEVVKVQALWQKLYHMPDLATDGSQWDRLFADGDRFSIGSLECRVIHSPGHTLASITYVIGDAAFIHDTLFMPDSGSARADFPGADAGRLWASICGILDLPDETRLFTGHDYCPGGRAASWESTVGEQKRKNIHLQGSGADFIAAREARDRTLPFPKLLLHALQINLNAGRLPPAEADGRRYLKIPLNAFATVAW